MIRGTESVERKVTVVVTNRFDHGFALVAEEIVSLKKTPKRVFLRIRRQRGVNRTQYQVGDEVGVFGSEVPGLIKEVERHFKA